MVNNKLPMNHHHQQQQPKRMMKVKNGSNNYGATSNGGGVPVQKQQEDEILEVNLIGVNDDLGDFTEFLDTGQLSDMVMRCSDGRFIECHRLMLAARARNLRHFMCGRNFQITELVFRNCVKFDHLQALVNLIYRGRINGQDHQITSTLWKLFKIFGVRVTAKCFKNKELAHELKYDSVEGNAEKGAMKFEKIIREFRSETRRKTRRRPSATGNGAVAANGEELRPTTTGEEAGAATTTAKPAKRKHANARPPGVIVISDDEQGEWSSASCSSSISSLSSSSSEGEQQMEGPPQPPPQRITPTGRQQQTNGKARTTNNNNNSNSAMKTSRNERMILPEPVSAMVIQELQSGQPIPNIEVENWDSSGSSEGEYVESYKPPQQKKQKSSPNNNHRPVPTTVTPPSPLPTPSCLKYNQNEMTITVKSSPSSPGTNINQQEVVNNVTPTTPTSASNPVKDTESEAIICSPQIMMFNIKPEPIDDEEDEEVEGEEDDQEMGMLDEVDMEQLGIKMEIVEDENYEQTLLAQDRNGNRLPPPLLIPLQSTNRQVRQLVADDSQEHKSYIRDGKLEQFIMNCRPDSKPPPNFPPFILRNPRGNQTRTYTTDNLWSALMDVKSGESIYRASQQHKVPRKTLRNWMKRCCIKSAYPMPSQLKEAAEKKKLQKYTY